MPSGATGAAASDASSRNGTSATLARLSRRQGDLQTLRSPDDVQRDGRPHRTTTQLEVQRVHPIHGRIIHRNDHISTDDLHSAFRPFAISVPAEDCARYFDGSPSARFMATMGWVRAEARSLLGGFLLPGDRIRLHMVEREANPMLWQLLKRFGERAPAPMVVNTSFNLFGEPLVITPRDAVRSFFCSGIDALMIGNFLLTKA